MKGYIAAVLATAAAAALRLALNPLLGRDVPFITFFPAVAFVAWYGGIGPAAATLALSALTAAYLFISPQFSLVIDALAWASLGVFLVAGSMIAMLAESLRQAQRRAEHQSEGLRTTLASIGDGVIVTDGRGRVRMLNPIAESLTGWKSKDARDRPLEEVFRIVNEQTRKPVENPVEKVLRLGTIVGLANHTVLIARDGGEHPIDDSAAPIREGDEIVGVVLVFRDVSERRRAESAALQLAAIVQSSDDAIFSKDLHGKILSWNRGAEKLYGYTADEVIGQPVYMLVPDDRHDEIRKILAKLRGGELVDHYETVRRCKNGTLLDVSIVVSPLQNSSGEIIGASAIARDITAQKRAEHEMKLQTLVLERMLEGVSLADENGIILYTNPAENAMFGYEPGELYGQHVKVQNAYPPEENERIVAEVIEHLKNHGTWSGEWRNRRKDGSEFLTSSRITALDVGGRMYWVCVQEDITDRQRARAELQESESRFRQLAENVADVFYVIDTASGALMYINPAYERVWGRSCQSLYEAPRSFLDAVHPDDRGRIAARLERQQRGEATSDEYRITRPDGSIRWIWDRAFPVRDASGLVLRTAGIAEDITARKQTELDLRFLADASRTLATLVSYETTLQNVAQLAVPNFADWCVVHIAGEDGQLKELAVAHVNPAKVEFAKEFGQRYPVDMTQPTGIPAVYRSGQPELVGEIPEDLLRQAARDDEHWRMIQELGPKSFLCVPLSLRDKSFGTMTFLTAESGRRYTSADLAIAEDLAYRAAIAVENARLYAELRDEHRRKDEFLAMLAHELRNPLAPIRSGLEVLSLSGIVHESIPLMRLQLEHMVRLVDDLLDVSRIMRGRIQLRKEPVQLGSLLSRAVETVRPLMDASRHTLTVDVPQEPIWIDADPVRLSQVVANLLTNAAKYTDAGGRVQLSARRDNGSAVISVVDNGIGISPELLPRVFELFTQADTSVDRSQGGLGIGLTLVRHLVDLHGGSVSARSDGVGKGSQFTVRVPAIDSPQVKQPVASPEPAIHKRRILIVDDNVPAARMLQLIFEQLGKHDVRLAHDGPTALTVAAEHRPELVLLDIGLPRMNGYEVAKRLREAPELDGLLLVAVTGYGADTDRRRSTEAGFDEHLVKPPELSALQALLTHPKLKDGQGPAA